MRLPRMRFTIRSMMFVVAVVAVAIVVLPLAYVRLVWLYNTPPTTNALFVGGVYPVRSPGYVAQPPPPFHPVGQPVQVQCDYDTGLLPRIPTGLPYRATVAIKLMDSFPGTVLESHQASFVLFAGQESWKEWNGRFQCDLTPRSPRRYVVRYEIYFTDLFGREALGACHTLGL